MAAIALNETALATLKNSLRDNFPEVKSSHLSEACAYALGFRTNASLLAAMNGPEIDRPFFLLHSDKLIERLGTFGYSPPSNFDFEAIIKPTQDIVSTMSESAYRIKYKTDREKAWRNLMISAINAALDQKLFTLRRGDNRFKNDPSGAMFKFFLPNGLPACGAIRDIGFDELSIHAAVNPKMGDWVTSDYGGFRAGDAFGTTWLERERGAWMQTSMKSFRCRRLLLSDMASIEVSPHGYGDRGRVIM